MKSYVDYIPRHQTTNMTSVTHMQSFQTPIFVISILHLLMRCLRLSIVWMFLWPFTMMNVKYVLSAMIH